MVEKTIAEADLDKLMQTIREELNQSDANTDGIPADSMNTKAASPALRDATQGGQKADLRDLMNLSDDVFINEAYIMLLGRAADATGLKVFVERLQKQPKARLSILHEIKNSEEGRKFAAPVVLPPAPRKSRFPAGAELQSFFQRLLGVQGAEDMFLHLGIANIFQHLEELRTRLAASEAEGIALRNELNELRKNANQTAADAAELKTATPKLEAKIRDHWRYIADQTRRLNILVAEARKRLPEPLSQEQMQTFINEEASQLSAFYATFEDRYRGSREDIMQRQGRYLEYVHKAAEATDKKPFVDIGCGRGEFLELLRANHLKGIGLDLNPIMIGECEQHGLEAHLGDAVSYLRALPAGSLAGVSAFHIIEHLPLEKMIQLFDEALRVLAPGGMLICETPNPANLFVAAERFYLDPTHRNPLPSEMVSFLVEARGFIDVTVLPLHPVAHERRAYDDPMLALLQEKVYGPQDYGVIGWRA